MESKRAVLVIVSALPHNGVLYEYGMRLARDEGATTLLIDYNPTAPEGWLQYAQHRRPALSDLLAGRVSLHDVVVPSAACQRFHIACGIAETTDRTVPVASAVLAEGYDAVMVVSPLHARDVDEWLDCAETVLLACTPDAVSSEGVRQSLGVLRAKGIVPQLLVDCRESDESAAHREATDLAEALGLEPWAILDGSHLVKAGAPPDSPTADAGTRMRAIKQLDDAARRRADELSEAWDWIYGHDPEAGADGGGPARVESAAATTTDMLAVQVEVAGEKAPDRAAMHLAIDQLLDTRAQYEALTGKERSLAARLQRAEQQARALQEEPYILDDSRINPRYIERLSHLAQVKEEYREFCVENRLDEKKQTVGEQEALVRRLLSL